MAKTIQFDEFEGHGKAVPCAACEEMLVDALDGMLDAVDQGWFDRHVAGCAACSAMVADAQRGAAWLELLKTPRPEPSAELLERILAQTAGAPAIAGLMETGLRPEMVPAVLPRVTPANVLAFRPRPAVRFEPRLAMTAAMAFFSLALTLNLAGVKLNQIRLSDLNPANLKHSYYEANASAVRYYDNLRVVRVLESRVEDVRQSRQDAEPARPQRTQGEPRREETAPDTKPAPKREKGPGVSRTAPAAEEPRPGLVAVRAGSVAGAGKGGLG